MASATAEPPTLRSPPSFAALTTSPSVAATGAPSRRSYSCYNCSYSFHITPTSTTSTSSPSSFRCPSCHHRHLIPHHTIFTPPSAPHHFVPRPALPTPPNFEYATVSMSLVSRLLEEPDNLIPVFTDIDPYRSESPSTSSESDYEDPILEFTDFGSDRSAPPSTSFVASLPVRSFPQTSTPLQQSCSICLEDFEINSVNSSPINKLPCGHCFHKDCICLEDFEINSVNSSPINKLPCGHCFHKDCIVQWLQRRNTCPLCRCKLPKDPRTNERVEQGTNRLERESNDSSVTDLPSRRARRVVVVRARGRGSHNSASGYHTPILPINDVEVNSDAMQDEDGDILMADV